MNYDCPYNSRDKEYKTIYGASKKGEKIGFKIIVPRDFVCSGASLYIRKDDCENFEKVDMFWAGMCEYSHEFWEVEFTPSQEGIYWYLFKCQTQRGLLEITQSAEYGGIGFFGNSGKVFQQTVYEEDYQTPDWFKGGIMYQIFPDRFASSKIAKRNVPDDRIIREDWIGGVPEFRPDQNNKVLNNDYFGGDLQGITNKLDYLKSLGVTCIYLNPIFEAHSNHRYDTADYMKIDSLLGTEKDLSLLCKNAKKHGMHVILDGVFSHTGCDSIYFNRYNRYSSVGAFNSQQSPYYSWYSFQSWPNKYSSWWGIRLLPEVVETSESFLDFIAGEDGVLRKWIRAGIKGWRLDVADELPDGFLDRLRTAVKAEDKDALIIGEVWEDASNKCSYGYRRRYLLGKQLDSVMNYPFSNAILDFVKGGVANKFADDISNILENYPPQSINCLMNHIGTHDTERALTYLAGESCDGRDRNWQSQQKLSPEKRKSGLTLLKIATALQYTLPGVPSIYYGDEVGVEGYRDPFNRTCYPWGHEDKEILEWYKLLGKIRNACPALVDGKMHYLYAVDTCVAYERISGDDSILCAVNRGGSYQSVKLSKDWIGAKTLVGNAPNISMLSLPPYSCAILGKGDWVKSL